jgi:formate/nitrite transporter
MAYVKPDEIVAKMIEAGVAKGQLPLKDLLIRGFLSGALLGFATTLAFTATIQTGLGIVGGLVFPVGFVMIVLLGLELVTGNFAVVPLGVLEGRIDARALLRNWGWVFVGNLLGGLVYAFMFVAVTSGGSPIAVKLAQAAEAKTTGYAQLGALGMTQVLIKAVLCNWMVTLGVVMSLTSASVIGKTVAMWLPILIFFAQGFEHSVVNMFLIPAGIILGAKVSLADWWLWNQIPVTVGNLVGGFLFTGLALYATHHRRAPATHELLSEAAPPRILNEQFGTAQE